MVTKWQNKNVTEPLEIKCDKCGMTSARSTFEFNEFVCIEINAGYGSRTWGDMMTGKLDLCQYCAFEMFAPYARLCEHGRDEHQPEELAAAIARQPCRVIPP